MNKILALIILNGVPNAGKSSVAQVLQREIPNTVHLEVDALRNMFKWIPIDEAFPIALENALAIMPNFFARGLNVVLDYPLYLDWYNRIVREAESHNVTIHTYTLRPALNVVSQQRGAREISPEMSDRIKKLYLTDMHDLSIGKHIDNSNLTAEQTAAIILSDLKKV